VSEYQYYQFQAVDRPLGPKQQEELRAISTRACITASSFTNHYEWGDLKADPARLLERYFDLFVYVANWGSRRFAMRLPEAAVDPKDLAGFDFDEEVAALRRTDGYLIVDIWCDDIELDEWDDGRGWMAALAPVRADLLAGDLRLFYLVWLLSVDVGLIPDDALEPLPGIAPLTAALGAVAEFFAIDGDLLEVAAGGEAPAVAEPSREAVDAFIRALPEEEKTALLLRNYDGDAAVGAELRRRCRRALICPGATVPRRTAGALRAEAGRLAEERSRIAEERAAIEGRRREEERARARAECLAGLATRGEAAWREVEDCVALRNAAGYDRAATLLSDLGEIARGQGSEEDFAHRIAALRTRHERKGRFIERLDAAGLGRVAS